MNDRIPDLSRNFPQSVPNLKVNNDLDNNAHGGPHFDVIQGIPGGVDKLRISPNGEVRGGTTQIGKNRMDW